MVNARKKFIMATGVLVSKTASGLTKLAELYVITSSPFFTSHEIWSGLFDWSMDSVLGGECCGWSKSWSRGWCTGNSASIGDASCCGWSRGWPKGWCSDESNYSRRIAGESGDVMIGGFDEGVADASDESFRWILNRSANGIAGHLKIGGGVGGSFGEGIASACDEDLVKIWCS